MTQAAPYRVSTQKMTRQCAKARMAPPMVGARIGATPMTRIRRDIMMAAAWPSLRSRTTAREITMPADAPNAATARKMARIVRLGASAQPMVLRVKTIKPDHQRDAAAEAVRQRALGDLPDGEAGEPRRQRELRGAGGGPEGGLHRRERRQIHIGGGRTDRDEQTEQVGQPGRVLAGNVGAHPGVLAG